VAKGTKEKVCQGQMLVSNKKVTRRFTLLVWLDGGEGAGTPAWEVQGK
jgi:hypothetical protein